MKSLSTKKIRTLSMAAMIAIGALAAGAAASAPAQASTAVRATSTTVKAPSGAIPIPVTATSTAPIPFKATTAVPFSYTNGCSSSQATWVHLYNSTTTWFLDEADYCVGFKGTTSLPKNSTLWLCSGNNHGSLEWYKTVNGVTTYYTGSFSEGNSYTFGTTVRVLHISIAGWSGSSSC
jgi:hypothetical protein